MFGAWFLGREEQWEKKRMKDMFVKAPLLRGLLKATIASGTGIRVPKLLLLE